MEDQASQSTMGQSAKSSIDAARRTATCAGPTVISNRPSRVPTIIYASRTHSQLSQVVRELRNTRYRPLHAVLGAREQMCVNPKVKKESSLPSEINHDCNKMGKERRCRYRNNLEGFVAPSNEQLTANDVQPVMDMEDLVEMGKKMHICPFYYTRSQVEKAELLLIPYNYLFDKDARETTLKDVPWDNAVVIFDEAHNLESFASESASFDLSTTDIAGCVREISRALDYFQTVRGGDFDLKTENLVRLKEIFLRLEDYLIELGQETSYEGQFMMNFFEKGGGINHANHTFLIDEARKINDVYAEAGFPNARHCKNLEHFVQCLKRVFGHDMESRCLAKASSYRVHVSPRSDGSPAKAARTISYWCFAPSLAMEELSALRIRSIIVTSGTLSPLPSYSMELGLKFNHTLENPHIISDDQIYVRVVGKGVTGKVLNSSYERRKDEDYYSELGNTLVSLANVTPDGMLVFFPSYGVMEECLHRWGGPSHGRNDRGKGKPNFFSSRRKVQPLERFSFPEVTAPRYGSGCPSPWTRLLAAKSIVIEPRSSADLPDAISEFQRFLAKPKSRGCVLMGVCRGKISEGIDFSNEQSRAVVITGLPFPPSHDPKVKMKRAYLEFVRAKLRSKSNVDGGFGLSGAALPTEKLSGNEWYSQQAHRAVNQAIGRVIRNRTDYGAVLLLDSRFEQIRNQEGLSRWVRPHIRSHSGIGEVIRNLVAFYRDAEATVKQVMKLESETVLLEYEEEPDELELTKIALVAAGAQADKSSMDPSNSHSHNESGSRSYVPPTQIIATLDVNDASSGPSKDRMKPKSPGETVTIRESIFDREKPAVRTKMKPTPGESSRRSSVAVALFKQASETLSASELVSFKKAVVAMNTYGKKNDSQSYLASAREIAKMIVKRTGLESLDDGKSKKSMMLLFMELQPSKYRREVEDATLRLGFHASAFGAACKESLAPAQFKLLRSLAIDLLRSIWCCPNGKMTETKEYIAKAQPIVDILVKSAVGETWSKSVGAFIKLIPRRYATATATLANDIETSEKLQKLKAAGVSKSVSKHCEPNPIHAHSNCSSSIISSSTKVPKRKYGDGVISNPYTRKKPTTHVKESMGTKKLDQPLASVLQAVENDTFVERNPSDIAKIVQQSAPCDFSCPVCSSDSSDEPCLAECGHIACRKCWTSWLKKSPSCPTCRADTSLQSLALVTANRDSNFANGTQALSDRIQHFRRGGRSL